MSGENNNVRIVQRSGGSGRYPNASAYGVSTLERPRYESLTGIRAAEPTRSVRAAEPTRSVRAAEPTRSVRAAEPTRSVPVAGSRPLPPWDLTTRVPAASARHTNPEDLTLFAMQLLPAEDSSQIARHVEHCVECRRELAQIRGDLGAYAFTVEAREPAASSRERLLKQVGRERKAIPISHTRSAATIATFGRTTSILVADAEEPAAPSHKPVLLAWVGWGAAALFALASVVLFHNIQNLRGIVAGQQSQITRVTADARESRRVMDAVIDPQAQRVTLTTKPMPPSPVGRTTYNPEKGALVFLASDMDQLQPDKTYELWLMPADGSNPVPAGTFHPDIQGNASVMMPSLPKGIQAKGFNVSIEDEGGAQTPTKPFVMSGF